MKFKSLFRRNHNQGSPSSDGVRSYQQPPATMESAVFPPNNNQPQATEKLQHQLQPKVEAMDNCGATAVGFSSSVGSIDRCDNEYVAELEKLRMEVNVLKEQRDEAEQNLAMHIESARNVLSCSVSNNKVDDRRRYPSSAPASIAPPNSASQELLDTHDWDKHSNSSVSEVSVACLQDRIIQMEETHYSTNEELQATLQELADLQSQLYDLQHDNERLGKEKGVLLESLCQQTEKLEDARTKVDALQGLFLVPGANPPSTSTEREEKLVELLKSGQAEREAWLAKQEELIGEANESKRASENEAKKANQLLERVRFLECTVDSKTAEVKQLDEQLSSAKEEISSKNIEINRNQMLLDNARAKIEELEAARDKLGDKSELDELLNQARREKDNLESQLASLQERVQRAFCEIDRLKEQLANSNEQCTVATNNAKSALIDLQWQRDKWHEEVAALTAELKIAKEAEAETQMLCQKYVDEKRQLADVLSETQMCLANVRKALEEEKVEMQYERKEWYQFKEDLLTTVRVANDYKEIVEKDMEQIISENKRLREKVKSLEDQLDKLKHMEKPRALSCNGNSILNPVIIGHEISRRNNHSKLSRQDSQLSVKTLIESIENATKQAKTAEFTRSNSTSSLNGLIGQNENQSSCKTTRDCDFNTPLREHNSLSVDNNSISPCEETDPIKKCQNEDYNRPNGSILSSSRNMDTFARLGGTTEIPERRDPLQALVKNGGSKRNALLKWCQNRTIGYPNIDITNFSSSWNDGLALCALLHTYVPDKIPYSELSPAETRRNFSVAFEAAESVGIPTTLNINDMISQERPDWNLVMSYVTAIYKQFET
ncbi:cytospin-A [Adelges cooleyi]|uniref:cytospin-A n=1 Tax=Adelges cooleyi TaxID=133065 RepID=UPI00217FA3B0|nr:cytospin-A [Adelges cooleyi]XP_050420493.1 cytospin-A [Adelges cooleyi]XP_050420494.1 cytospin-A [Adelges cooleyi]XP_050420495.1 cytospin-A [Adelges cooleyi]